MDPQLSQDSLDGLLPMPQVSDPVTPEPPHTQLPAGSSNGLSKLQSSRVDNTTHMTPPPSTQVVPSSQRGKTRTPTPTMSHISTPPPTIELPNQSQLNRLTGRFAEIMTAEQIASASVEELRARMAEMQGALQEAKMAAAHHKLQYQMLSQESAAAIERMAVEARMAQHENEVIHVAEQAKAAATPIQPSPFQDGMIPVQKDLYQRMCREIQELTEERKWLVDDQAQKDKTILRQDVEIASLGDKVELMRDRIREYREQAQSHTGWQASRYDGTPRSTYNDPLRRGVARHEQPQPFAALLQASEMASQEARRPTASKKGHFRNAQSTSSLPTTPQRTHKHPTAYQTPSHRHAPAHIPSTAPQPRTSALRTPDVYAQRSLPMSQQTMPSSAALSDGTVSASEADDDSEAETDILEPDSVTESQASRTASQMLRSSREERRQKQASFEGRGMLESAPGPGSGGGETMRQSRLFGAVRKAGAERGGDGEPPAKRARTVGLGIAGVRG